MSRAGYYEDDDDPLALGRWRAQVMSATRGRRGQQFLRDLLASLDAMPEKRLITDELEVSLEADVKRAEAWAEITGLPTKDYHKFYKRPETYKDGDVCALGALGRSRGLPVAEINPTNHEQISTAFDIAEPLAREVVYINDECGYGETPEARWVRVRAWVSNQIKKPALAE